jgi:membrane-associated phospholipid phosphatase
MSIREFGLPVGSHEFRRAVGRHVFRRILPPAAVWYVLLVGVGLLLTHPLARLGAAEESINKALAAERTPGWNAVTAVVSVLADTPSIMAATAAFAVLLRWSYRRWEEPLALIAAVALQAVVFLGTTIVIDRPRPEVPPTSSFPSGHTGAAVALYVGLAVIAGLRLRRPLVRIPVLTLLVVLPLAVAAARLYRGMHYPSDIVFGALNGLVCLLIAVHVFLPADRIGAHAWRRLLPGPLNGSPSSPTTASRSAEASTSSES